MPNLPQTFDECFPLLVHVEGDNLDLSHNDPGNWTGGAVGSGKLTGSRFGISSATYPSVNKNDLTYSGAKALYARDFWQRADEMPAHLRFLYFSASVNSGQAAGGRWLQRAIAAQHPHAFGGIDGAVGDKTIAALKACTDVPSLLREFCSQRLYDVSQARIFAEDRLGLSRRLVSDQSTADLLESPEPPHAA